MTDTEQANAMLAQYWRRVKLTKVGESLVSTVWMATSWRVGGQYETAVIPGVDPTGYHPLDARHNTEEEAVAYHERLVIRLGGES